MITRMIGSDRSRKASITVTERVWQLKLPDREASGSGGSRGPAGPGPAGLALLAGCPASPARPRAPVEIRMPPSSSLIAVAGTVRWIRVVRLIEGTGMHRINHIARINHVRPADCGWCYWRGDDTGLRAARWLSRAAARRAPGRRPPSPRPPPENPASPRPPPRRPSAQHGALLFPLSP